jgi:hypothetical protein
MISFKSNQIHTVPENVFPSMLKWLILTNNKIEKTPKSIGDCLFLQKGTIAGNQTKELPSEMSNCVNLELLRISANKLQSIPNWLFELPKLSWIAFGGNHVSHQTETNTNFDSFDWNDFGLKEILGENGSGLISKTSRKSKKEQAAIKIFKGSMTCDGLPEDKMKISISTGFQENLIQILGKIKNHPKKKDGLIMKLTSPTFTNLGNPPSLETCTRDVFDEKVVFNQREILKIAKSIASVCAQLHSKGINHGDLYAHNILINKTPDCLFGDFGATPFYDINSNISHNIERVESRAFGCLLEGLLSLVIVNEMNNQFLNKWQKLITDCTTKDVKSRLSFNEILEELNAF